MFNKFLKKQDGQAIVLMAIALSVLLGFAALAIDGGNIYLNRAKAVNISDAAALAGAAELPDNPDKAIEVAKAFGVANGVSAEAMNVVIREDHQAITVTTNLNVSMFFAGVIGIKTTNVPANSTASVGIAASVPWIVPFVIPRPPSFNFNEIYVMRMYGGGPYPNGYTYPNDYTTDPVFKNYPLEDSYNITYKDVYRTNTKNVKIYKAANTTTTLATISNSGTEVVFISKPNNNWYQISCVIGGKTYTGYVSSGQITKTTVEDTKTLIKAKNIYPYQFDYMNVNITAKSGFSDYIGWLEKGYHETFSINDNMYYLDPSSGGKQSVDAFAKRLTGNADYTKAKLGDPRVMLIPVTENMLPRNAADNTKIKIIGFVGFFLEEVHKNSYGTSFWFTGRFLNNLYIGTGKVTYDTSADFGLRVIGLTD